MHSFKTLLAVLALEVCALASCTIIQHASKIACGTATTACTMNSGQGWATTGTGHLIIAAMESQASGQSITSVTGPGTFAHCDGTHTNCLGSEATGGESSDIFSTLNSTANASITINRNTAGAAAWAVAAIEVSCSGTLAADNSGNNSTSTLGTTQSGVGATLTGTNDFAVQMLGSAAANPNSLTQGYTIQESGTQMGFASLNNTTNGTQPNWTMSSSTRSATSAVWINDGQPPAAGHNPQLTLTGVGN